MIGAGELAVMKKSAIIVNTSRGPVIDEKAMTAALSRTSCSAPASTCSTRSRHRRTIRCSSSTTSILTAHLAGPTWESNITRLRNGFDNVQRVARGEAPLWVVEEMAGKI